MGAQSKSQKSGEQRDDLGSKKASAAKVQTRSKTFEDAESSVDLKQGPKDGVQKANDSNANMKQKVGADKTKTELQEIDIAARSAKEEIHKESALAIQKLKAAPASRGEVHLLL